MPGGTLLELAVQKGLVGEMLEALWSLEFDAIEVSSGFKIIPLEERQRLIEQAHDMGFTVFAEVGRKKPQLRMTREELLAEVEALHRDPRVWKIIVDGREHGANSCLYDSHGRPRLSYIRPLLSRFNSEKLVFEAPRPSQQAFFLRLLGPNANLANIPPQEVLSLESLRRGLRGDTLIHSTGLDRLDRDPPSARFIYFILEAHGMLTTREIQAITGLPERTIYEALRTLRNKGIVDYVYDKKRKEKKWYTL